MPRVPRKSCSADADADADAVPTPSNALSPLMYLWVLRILVPLGGHLRLFDPDEFGEFSGGLANALGFKTFKFVGTKRFNRMAMLRHIRQQYAQVEKRASKVRLPTVLAANCTRISGLIGLDVASQRLLAFTVLLHQDTLLQEATELLSQVSSVRIYALLSTLLGVSETSMRAALAPGGPLAQSGLVKIDHGGDYSLRLKLDLISKPFAERMMSKVYDPLDLFRDVIILVPPAELTLADFVHIQPLVDILDPLLREALNAGRTGVNVLLHGKPGTGKSQFVRVLAAALNATLFQVSSEDEDGDPIRGERRLRAYRVALSVVARNQALLVFDEAEDVFSGGRGFFSPPSPAQQSKAWVNRALENNPVPCLWLSNAVEDMDPAFIRRFDVVYEIAIPPRHQRARMIEALCGDLVTPPVIRRLAESEHLAPAVIARASAVARTIGNDMPVGDVQSVITRLVDHTLIAQGHPPLSPVGYTPLTEGYDPACAPADTDLVRLASGIAQASAARVCLYGPPGTGKTAFAHWLAQQLNKPLLIRRVSDLIGPYVGESERNLARAFREAAEEQAVLLLDEVDSFLLDRTQAQHSWEVTLVNEMLTQMEAFNGVFIAATNRMEHLDSAALRRFDLKLRFDYLGPHQAWRLLQHHAQALGLPEPDATLKVALGHLTLLTPGDYTTVARQARFRPFDDTAALVVALAAECAAKPEGSRRAIGFI